MTTRAPRAALLAALLALVLACCGPAQRDEATEPSMAPTSPGAMRLAVVGDSITDADSRDLSGGRPGPGSWVFYAAGGEVAFVGGWAEWGATTAQMAAAARPVPADVLVILAGTNDAGSGVPFAQTAAHLVAVADAVGAQRVVLSAVPPIDAAPEVATELNARLSGLARDHGWEWVDAAAGLRDGDRFAPGMSTDGLHPTRAGARVIGGAVRDALLARGPVPRAWEHSGMAMREIRVVGDPVLRTPCAEITDIDDRVRSLVEDLLETVDADGRAGLAANQIGVGLRAFSWNIDDEVGYVLNPRLVEVSEDEYQDGDEGCLSVPGLWFPTQRAWYARVEGIDLDGKKVVVEGEELMGRCLQHECDHLDGMLYLDRLEKGVRKKAMKAIREQL